MSATLRSDFLTAKAAEVRRRRVDRDGVRDDILRARCHALPPAPPLAAALRHGDRVAMIAEFKRRSPSAGALAAGEDPVAVSAGYSAAGAAGLSVLTDADHFGGSLADLEMVASAHPGVPVLRKDFIVDTAQLFEARAAGASAALLIAAMLDDRELTDLLAAATDIGLECLVEVHTQEELARAAAVGASIIGINNRDLRRLTTDLVVTDRLAPRAPRGTVVVSESGIRTAADVERVRDAGAHAVLVGEVLLRLSGTGRGDRVRELAAVPR